MVDSYLPIAVRAYTTRSPQDEQAEDRTSRARDRRERSSTWPEYALIIDTETTIDASQRLTFGSYRYLRLALTGDRASATCVEEGLFRADDLSARDPRGLAVLQKYVASHRAAVAPGVSPRLKLLSRREFVNRVLYPAALRAQATTVTFTALFDIARIAYDVRPARGHYQGGFSFALWQYRNAEGVWRENKYRPRITVKSIDSKRAMKRFTMPWEVEAVDLTPVEPTDDQPSGVVLGGGLLDLRQLVYALTNEGHSLESASRVFGVPYAKRKVQHGKITPEYVDYNREDVWATAELYMKAMEEFAKCVPSA